MTQDEALSILKTGTSVFITGEPGSGKTHTINRFVQWLRDHRIEPAITASTGIAATHIGGRTIHSWSGVGVKRVMTPSYLSRIAGNTRIAKRVRETRILIIDEISMLSANTLSMVEAVCRKVRGGVEPFGGLQVVLVGDFFQLPPVVTREQEENKQSSLVSLEDNGHSFAFSSTAWNKLHPTVCYLSEQHRQEDSSFLDLLSAMRRGTINDTHHALLKQRSADVARSGVTQLFSHNVDVDHINSAELRTLSGAEETFVMTNRGPAEFVATLKKGCLSPETLVLKVGARVMFTKNDASYRFVNGTLGTVVGFSKESGYPMVKTNTGRNVEATPLEWSIEDGGTILARIVQVPLRLAWAMTVHKSQGMSLDAAHMDLSQVFEYGQGYVALSRVRTLSGLTLAGLNERALEVHPAIRIKDSEFRDASQVAREQFLSVSAADLLKKQNGYIRRCGGSVKADHAVRQEKSKRSTYAITRELLSKKLSLEGMAKERGLNLGTILTHLEKLVATKKIDPRVDLAYLRPKSERFEKMIRAFEKIKKRDGETRLAPVRQVLGDSFSFEELRVARLFLNS
ncbi:AAA family ATPase [Candidatus Uhrbacteria bacterium CG10_big_fil_rev_8_21_14_0_10_48_11]|uniref:AAA family ATPase n=1 Tax=Candidatus Uhrbacteria bacterium CG10_big_fil_rev_8_21_14_0_10_48_11 TaxID=1975037 RepID=A0A2M8LDL0_9BACT|nr:MAG: AAA family ATPase [Candidatus Uhrbacteria bacterium CG10_big_fil_rev_8_21_14_0_10_48_11]